MRALGAASLGGVGCAAGAHANDQFEPGDLPPDTDVPALAAFYSAVTRGMAVQARDGGGPQKLKAIADVAMQAWPSRRSGASTPGK